jgi:cytochrome bd-type quinol oxidase subunit 1
MWSALSSLLAQTNNVGEMGTAAARQGAAQRLAEPNYYDVVFPVIAFVLVIIVPAVVGLWVIQRVVRDPSKEADER